MSECQICAEKYNKSTRKPIQCLFCNDVCCKTCVLENIKTHIDSTPNHCLFCKADWDIAFWFDNFVKKEIDEYFKFIIIKKKIDSEVSKLPEYQEKALMAKKIKNNSDEITKINDEINELTSKINLLKGKKHLLQNENDELHVNIWHTTSESSVRFKFTVSCPNENCNFLLNSKFFCENCEIQYCSECLEKIVNGEEEEHVCNEDTLKTIKEIKKTSKPCPGCSTSIQKLDGCDQMWCPFCKKGFSWRTGKIETGRIHNPEYFRWLHENGGMEEENAVPVRHNNCVFPDTPYFTNLLRVMFSNTEFVTNLIYFEQLPSDEGLEKYFFNILRCGLDMEHWVTVGTNTETKTETNLIALRLRFLNKEFEKEHWENEIKKLELNSMKINDITNIHNLVKIVILENCWKIMDYRETTKNMKEAAALFAEVKRQCDKIRHYANNAYAKMSSTKFHSCKKYYIDQDWRLM